jgi:protein phosphatase
MRSESMVRQPEPTPPATGFASGGRDATQPAIIGDIHGCGEELRELLHDLDRALGHPWIILIGDLLTKGPAPHLVVTELRERRARGQRISMICGNHDQRMLLALVQVEAGLDPHRLPRAEREAWHALAKRRMIAEATELLVECNETILVQGLLPPVASLRPPSVREPLRWTAVHGGIEPRLGLARTPDQLKIHIKAESEHEEHWWERYRGDEGLIVVGHKPLRAPMILRRRDGSPMVVNIDTGCAYGNTLTAYLPHEDRIVSVPSRQPRGEKFRSLRLADEHGSTRGAVHGHAPAVSATTGSESEAKRAPREHWGRSPQVGSI